MVSAERVYYRYTDAANWERADVARQDGDLLLKWECMGTGSMRGMVSCGIQNGTEVLIEVVPFSPETGSIRVPRAGKCDAVFVGPDAP